MKRKKGFMDLSLFKKTISELRPYLFNVNLYFQGEPLLHPSFYDFLAEIRGLHAVVSTNGHFINAESAKKIVTSGLKKIIISLDGPDQATYSRYRINGNVENVIKGINELSAAKRHAASGIKIEIQVLLNRFNEERLPEIRKIADDTGVGLVIKSMQFYNVERAGEWMPSDKRYCRYRFEKNNYEIRSSFPRRCARLWLNPVVTWDMKVVPCCFDKDAEYIMGDLRSDSFREIWHGKNYSDFRKTILTAREKIPICCNCTSGMRNVRT